MAESIDTRGVGMEAAEAGVTAARTTATLDAGATEAVLREVFLAPRVVDRRALEDYSATLKQLIREAAGTGSTLSTTASEAARAQAAAREAAKELHTRLELAAKIMPPLGERITRAEQLAALATEPARLAEQLKERLAGLLAQKVAEVEALAQGAVARELERLEERRKEIAAAEAALDGRVGEVMGLITAHEQRIAETLERHAESMLQKISAREQQMLLTIDHAEAGALERVAAREARALDTLVTEQGRLAEQQATIAAACGEMERTAQTRVRELEDKATLIKENAELDVERAARKLGERVTAGERQQSALLRYEKELQDRVNMVFRSAEERLAPLRELCDRDLREIDKRLRRVRLEAEAASGPGLKRVEELCAAVGALLGPDAARQLGLPGVRPEGVDPGTGESTAGPIEELVARAEALRSEAAAVLRTFDQLTAQAEAARQGLGQDILKAADEMDGLWTRLEGMRQTMQQTRAGLDALSEQAAMIATLRAGIKTKTSTDTPGGAHAA